MDDPILSLGLRSGRYEGAGVAHNVGEFTGVLVIEPPLNPATLVYRFTATANGGAVLHAEVACLGRDAAGVIEIVHASSDISGLQRFRLGDGAGEELVMVHGELDDRQSFREIVRLRFSGETGVRLSYDWAMPGDAMVPRSWVELVKVMG